MKSNFNDKIHLQVLLFDNVRDIASFNFKHCKSLEYLDLSANEYRFRKKSIFTKEDIRKRVKPERHILYTYHLDMSTDLESICCWNENVVDSEDAFHLNGIFVCDSVYGLGFETYIVKAIISNQDNRIRKLRSHMTIIELLNFRQCLDSVLYFFDNILSILVEEDCRDSELVMNFVNLLNFDWWLFNRDNTVIITYVLHHAQIIRRSNNVWEALRPETNHALVCFLRNKINNFRVLLMYGTPTIPPTEFNFSQYINIPNWVFHIAVQRGIMSYRRAFLAFQLLYAYEYHRASPEGLCCIWSCIKDPFLSHEELFGTLIPVMSLQTIIEVHHFYAMFITRGSCQTNPCPRALKHLCRAQVRSLLALNYQLPDGISSLKVPKTLKHYLKEF